jgi:asparagine synthase (glutamine-hydrolysing)
MWRRGPDFGRVALLDTVAAFGHRRLSIIDLSPKAHQPMWDATCRYAVTYNGEIYNYQELRSELEALGSHFQSSSDTEVALESFVRWGPDCFKRFNGMFALAIWDRREQELILARDRFGKKPLYFTFMNGELSFASELTALLMDPSISERAAINIAGLNHYLALGYILSPLTILRDVEKLEPATYLLVGRGGVKTRARYWDYRDAFGQKENLSEGEASRRLDGLLNEAVRLRLISDVPVGSLLSGGLDSSGVSALAQKHANGDLRTFSMDFRQPTYSEGEDALLVARFLGTDHLRCYPDADERPGVIEEIIDDYDEPFSDTSIIPMWEVCRQAAQRVKVVLSGDGADEIFAGYLTYRADTRKRQLDILPLWLRRLLAKTIDVAAVETNAKTGLGFKARQFAKGLPCGQWYAHYAWRELHNEGERVALIGHAHEEEVRDSHPYEVFRKYFMEAVGLSPLSQSLYVDAKTWMADNILVKVDRASMAHSLELRAPYLDVNVVEFVAGLPDGMKMTGNSQKRILKMALASYLPPETLDKKKAGFNAPVNTWLGNHRENEFRFFNKMVLERKVQSGRFAPQPAPPPPTPSETVSSPIWRTP